MSTGFDHKTFFELNFIHDEVVFYHIQYGVCTIVKRGNLLPCTHRHFFSRCALRREKQTRSFVGYAWSFVRTRVNESFLPNLQILDGCSLAYTNLVRGSASHHPSQASTGCTTAPPERHPLICIILHSTMEACDLQIVVSRFPCNIPSLPHLPSSFLTSNPWASLHPRLILT